MTIYRFKIYNGIGNVFNQGKMVGTREQVEAFCKKQIRQAMENNPCDWASEIEMCPIKRKERRDDSQQW